MATLNTPVGTLRARASRVAFLPTSETDVWRSLHAFCMVRVAVALIFAWAFWGLARYQLIGAYAPRLAAVALIVFLVVSILLLMMARLRLVSHQAHLTAQVVADVVILMTIMYATGGVRSGIGLLLLATLAAAGLVSRGLTTYFYAAIAALGVLLEQSWQFLTQGAPANDYVPAGILASIYFVVAAGGHTLAKYARGAEQAAIDSRVDLANLAQINELVIRDIQDGFVVVDEAGIIRQHNPQSEAMISGLAKSNGRTLAVAAPQLAVLLTQWRLDNARIFPMVHDSKTQKDYQVRFVAIGDDDDKRAQCPTVVFIEDIGRIRLQAQQMKLVALGRLTASIAHEIRNPLSSINHAAELLQEDVSRSAADARLLTIISENSQRLDRMVQEVLHLNRRDRAHPEPINGAAYLAQFVRDFCANEKVGPGVVMVEASECPRLIFDRGHFDQVLWNLTRNAYRHSDKTMGSVVIRLEMEADARVNLSVHDNGPGVAVEALPHLFEPFFTTDAQGTGLGLYVARELAEVNGARLDYVPADKPGVGATFCLSMIKE